MIKEYWDYIITFLGAIIGFLWYFLTLKNREVRKYKTAVGMLKSEREADLLEVEINTIKGNRKRTNTEIKKYNKELDRLNEKRDNIKEIVKNMDKHEIIKYWNEE